MSFYPCPFDVRVDCPECKGAGNDCPHCEGDGNVDAPCKGEIDPTDHRYCHECGRYDINEPD